MFLAIFRNVKAVVAHQEIHLCKIFIVILVLHDVPYIGHQKIASDNVLV